MVVKKKNKTLCQRRDYVMHFDLMTICGDGVFGVAVIRGCSWLALDVPAQLLGLIPQVGSAVRLQR